MTEDKSETRAIDHGQGVGAAADAPTAPFEAGAEHARLRAMAGSWRGPTKTWLDPSAPPEESTTHARADLLLGGRFVRLDYRGTVGGGPHAGQMLIGFERDAKRYVASWVDSFHTGTGIMHSTGEAGAPTLSVLGSYEAGGERWGWRTALSQPDPDTLVIEAYNISPAGEEFPAIDTRLERVRG